MDSDTMHLQRLQDKIDQQSRTIDVLTARIRMLEEENHEFALQLKNHGIPVRESSRTAMELPPPIQAELEYESSNFRLMADPEKRLAEDLFSTDPVYVLEKSDTAVDVGHWLSSGLLWVAATADRLVLFAAGRKPFIQEVPFNMLYRSVYNHVTGELILAPATDIPKTKIKLSPSAAYQFLAQIYQQEEMNA